MSKEKYYGLQVHTLTYLKVDAKGESIDGKQYEYTGDHSGFCDGIDNEYLREVDDDKYITKDMFTQDSYRGNYYANKNAVMFDLQNGKQNVVCFCDNKFTAEAIVEGLNLIDNLEGDGAELRK